MRGLVFLKTSAFCKVRSSGRTLLIHKDRTSSTLPEIGTLIEIISSEPGPIEVITEFRRIPDTTYHRVLEQLFSKEEFIEHTLDEIGADLDDFLVLNGFTYMGYTAHKGRHRFFFKR